MRKAEVKRKTGETDIVLKIDLDGKGKNRIDIPQGFITHMLQTFSKHSLIDLDIQAKGDIEVDFHHIVEDIGICLGQAFDKALGDKKQINRFGWAVIPMDEALTLCSIDISGRPVFKYDVKTSPPKVGDFDVELIREFFKAFSDNAKIALHINNLAGSNAHHAIESVFKAFSKACQIAVAINKKSEGVPSIKNVI
ncbi:MAG: imidazoleglycerol-phosphate dehydratase HisB [Spirochaetes bacterium]|nr:imidazoleglycerol-phosphate dehydratase HisB [Spirochaetota bacterium]